MSSRPVLHLTLGGGVRCTLAGRPVPLSSSPVRRVLGYIALMPGQAEHRGRLAAMMWENSNATQARQNLRQALHKLRRDLGADWPGLVIGRGEIALRPGWVVTDLDDALLQLKQGVVPESLTSGQLAPGRILASDAPAGEMFESWLRIRQRDAEVALTDALTALMDGDAGAVSERAAEALLRLDPSDERAARHLMRRLHLSGRTGRALELYETLWTCLTEEYDTEPSAPTLALIAQIKLGTPLDPTAPPGGSAPGGMAGPPGQERLSIGLSAAAEAGAPHVAAAARLFRSDLMASLLRFRSFEIVDLQNASRPVDYRLELSVAGARDHLMLLAVLIRARDGAALWSERWSGLAENWLATQAEVIARLASALSLTAARLRVQELRDATVARGAIDDWLMGNQALERFTAEGLEEAAACFGRVIRAAPEASMGYSSLARLKNGAHLMLPGRMRTDAIHAEAKALGARAVALDPLDARAHLARAWAWCLRDEHDHALAGFELACTCNPNDPWTALSSALGASFGGAQDRAVQLAGQVLAKDWTTEPVQWGFHAPIRFLGEDYAGCVQAAQAGGQAIPNLPAWGAAAHWLLGEPEPARRSWESFAARCHAHWSGDMPATREAVLAWFLSLFPIRDARQRDRLCAGARGAAGLD